MQLLYTFGVIVPVPSQPWSDMFY